MAERPTCGEARSRHHKLAPMRPQASVAESRRCDLTPGTWGRRSRSV